MFSVRRNVNYLGNFSISGARLRSTLSRPLLLDILPKRKMIKRLLFDMDSRLTIGKYMPIIEEIYKNLDNEDESDNFDSKFKGKVIGMDLILFRNLLKEIRTQTHTTNKNLVDLEEALIEKAAEMGDRDAITILSFNAVDDVNCREYTQEDREAADVQIEKLLELEHPLTLKMKADNLFRNNKLQESIEYYKKFLTKDRESFLSADVYKVLGMISFQNTDLLQAKYFFEKSLNLAPPSKLSQSHFMLGLIFESDPLRSRYHLEMSVQQGLKESFANIGYLELNYFKDTHKAIQWFKLGVEIGDLDCFIGLFDGYMKEEKWEDAKKIYDAILVNLKTAEAEMTVEQFESLRPKAISKLKQMIGADKFDATKESIVSGTKWSL